MYGGQPIHDEYLNGDPRPIAAHVEHCAMRANTSARSVRMIENHVNYMWYANQPFVTRQPGTTRLRYLNKRFHSKFIQVNLSFDAVRTLRGVMFYAPKAEARPKSPDPEDAARAHMSAAVANHIIDAGDLAGAYDRALELVHVTGCAWIKPRWDPTAGPMKVFVDQVPCPECSGSGTVPDQAGYPLVCQRCAAQGVLADPMGERGSGVIDQSSEMEEGDVTWEVINAADMLFDPGARRIQDAHYFTHRDIMHVARAWRLWGEAAGVSEKQLLASSSSLMRDASFFPALGGTNRQSNTDGYVSIMEHWERPSEAYPQGLFAVTCGQNVLSAGPLPRVSSANWCPFFLLPMYQSDAMVYPQSTVDLIQPLVMQHADHLSMAAARARASAQMRFTTTRQQAMQVDEQTGMLVYNHIPGHAPPQPLQLGGAGGEISGVTQAIEAAIQQVSAASDAARGKYDANTTDNATAMALIEERSTAPLMPIMERLQVILQRVVRYGVDIARTKYDDGRMIRLAGNGGAPEVHVFNSENVGESTDVYLKVVKNKGQSRAALLGQVNDAVKNGWLPPDIALELSEFGDIGALYDTKAVHRNKCVREIQTLRDRGFMPLASENDDHAIHLRDHVVQRAQSATNMEDNDPYLLALDEHINAHRAFQAQAQFQAAQAQMTGAAAYGMANAADPGAQPQAAVDAASGAGTAPPAQDEPVPGQSPVGEQPSLDSAAQTAQDFAQSMPPPGAT